MPRPGRRTWRPHPAAVAGVAGLTVLVAVVKTVNDHGTIGNVAGVLLIAVAACVLALRAQAAPAESRVIWGLLAGGAAMNALAEGLWTALDALGGDPGAASLGPDSIYLSSYALTGAAAWILVRRTAARAARASLPDVAGFLVVTGFASWQFFVASPGADDVPLSDRLVLAAYPLFDCVLLALAFWYVVAAPATGRVAWLIVAFTVLYTLSDVMYGTADVLALTDPGFADVTYATAFGVLGVAAVCRGDVLAAPVHGDHAHVPWRGAVARALIVSATLAIGPVTAMLSWRAGVETPAWLVAGVLGSAAVLVTARLVALVHQLERAERTSRQAEVRLTHWATHDALTDLPNRRLLEDRLTVAMRQARRDGRAVGVLFVDMDGFKAVNDTHGHAAGDRLLVDVAARLRAAVREADTVARVGGDEFVVALAGVRDLDEAHAIADGVAAAVRGPYSVDGTQLDAGASVGLALVDDGDADPAAAIARADAALGAAKRAGRGQVASVAAGTPAPLTRR